MHRTKKSIRQRTRTRLRSDAKLRSKLRIGHRNAAHRSTGRNAATTLSFVLCAGPTISEIDAAFASFARERPDALFVAPDALIVSRAVQFATLTARDKIPAAYTDRDTVAVGGLMSYGADIADMYRQVGLYTGSILKGAKPADLPVLQSTKFELVINLQTARALGIEVPSGLLSIADEVIE